jgi:glycosyltransferase involved in cell wall biosynthesis
MIGADIIHVEHPWQFKWVFNQVGDQIPVVFGAPNTETNLYVGEQISAPPIIANFIAREIMLLEEFAVQNAVRVLTVSNEDSRELAGRYHVSSEKFEVVPNGVDCDFFRPATIQERENRKRELGLDGKNVILFAGSMHWPNINAVEQILKWAEKWPDDQVRFLIVGTIGRYFMRYKHSRVVFTGSVETTKPYFEAADIAVNPIVSGSGTNLKQLEFMAIGLPTITTPKGARGFSIEHGKHGFIKPIDEIPDQIKWLIDHPERSIEIGVNARTFVEKQYHWNKIGSKLIGIYHETIKNFNQNILSSNI